MYLNNFILSLFYLPVLYFYLKYFNSIFSKDYLIYKKYFNRIIFYILLGLVLSMIVGYVIGTFPSQMSSIDIMRIINFLMVFIIPFVLIKSRLIYKPKTKKLFNIVSLSFVLMVGASLLVKGMGSSMFYGNLFGATTVNLTIVSTISFYGLFLYYYKKSKFYVILTILAWFVSFASLAKWNFLTDISVPILLYGIEVKKEGKILSKRLIKVLLITGLLFIVISPHINQYLNNFASLNNFSSFDNYLNSRVLRKVTPNNDLASGTLFDINGMGIKDGQRLIMWDDMFTRTLKKPLLGLGLGARPFDYEGFEVEDHSFIVFFISRFGFLLATLIFYNLFKLIKTFYKKMKNHNYPFAKYIYLALLLNFFFQGSVGQIWGQLPVTLFLGTITSFIFAESLQKKLNTNI